MFVWLTLALSCPFKEERRAILRVCVCVCVCDEMNVSYVFLSSPTSNEMGRHKKYDDDDDYKPRLTTFVPAS